MRKKDKLIFVLSGFGIAILLSLIISLVFVLTGVMKFDHKAPDWEWDMEDLLGSVKENLPEWDMDSLPEGVQQDILDWLETNLTKEDLDSTDFQSLLKNSTIVITGDASKPYDGTPLTCDVFYILNGAKIEAAGHRIEVKPNGTQTDIGSSSNFAYIAVFDEYGNEVTYDYYIVPKYGKLTVTDGETSAAKPNGQALDDISAGGLSSLASGELLKDPLGINEEILSQIEVLRINANTDGFVYLRYKSFGDYNGQGFSEPVPYQKNNATGVFNSTSDCLAMGTNRIAISVIADNLKSHFLPYYTTTEYSLKDDIMIYDYQKEYTLDFKMYDYLKSDAALSQKGGLADYNEFVHNNYIALDGGLKQELLALTGFSTSGKDLIYDIANYVRNSARYDTEFDSFPDDVDMVLYFLTESQKGICQHFAAAATAIYRAYGIPARYTVGFLAEAEAGKFINVSSKEAHAWVEIYLDDVGWIQIEVTGGGFVPTGGSDGGITVADEGGGEGDGADGGAGGGSKISDEPVEESDAQVASIVADKSGLYYLRMASYGDYTGREFSAVPVYNYSFGGIEYVFNPTVLAVDGNTGNLHVTVYDDSIENMLLTYYATDTYHLDSDAAVKTTLKEYDVPFKTYDIISGGAYNKNNLAAYNVFVRDSYLNISSELKEELLSLTGIDKDSPTLISDIADFVRNCATYDKNYSIPQGVDVITYFLKEGQKGICQHFAAAGTMIYRAYGIPARYTVGYVVAAQKDDTVDVLAKNAHAWVEIYIDDVGWIKVEVTPSDGLPEYRRTIKIINDGAEKVYDGEALSVTIDNLEIQGQLLEGHSLYYDGENLPSITDVKDSGVYNAPNFRIIDEASGEDVTEEFKDVYIWDYSECGTLTIKPCPILLTLSGEKTYDGTPTVKPGTVEVDVERLSDKGKGLCGGDELEIIYSDLDSDDAGDHKIGISWLGITNNGRDVTGNYEVNLNDKDSVYTINKKDIIVTTESKTWVYDGNYHSWGVFSASGIVGSDEAVAVSPPSIKDNGTIKNSFTIEIYRKGTTTSKTDNYNILYNDDNYGTLEVSNILYVSSDNESFEYDGESHAGKSYRVEGKDGAPLPNGFTVEYNPVALTDVGEEDNVPGVVIRNGNNVVVTGNYELNYKGCEDKKLSVYQRDITVTTATKEKPYDGTPLENGESELIIGGKGLVNNHHIAVVFTGSQTEVGQSPNSIADGIEGIKILDANNNVVTGNYNITFTEGTLKVTKRTLYVTSEGDTWTYDGTAHTNNDYTFEGLLSGDVVVTDLLQPASITDVGTVQNKPTNIIIRDKDGNNVTYRYDTENPNYSGCGTLEVAKRTLYVTSESNPDHKEYDGTALEALKSDYSFSNLAPSSADAVIIDELQPAWIINVGYVPNIPQNNSIKIKNGNGDDVTKNYTFDYSGCGTLEVTGKTLTVKNDGGTWTYDGMAHTNNDYTFEGLLDGDKVVICTPASITDAETVQNEPTYIEIRDNNGNGNVVTGRYGFDYSGCGTLEITPCDVNLVISGEKVYDGSTFVSNDNITYKAYVEGKDTEGFYNNQTAVISAWIEDASFGGYSSVINPNVNIYEGKKDVTGNYNIISVSGSVTVKKRDISVSTDDETVVYNGDWQHGTEISAETLVPGHEITATFDSYLGAGVYTNNISSYIIKDGNGNPVTDNYNVTDYHYGTFTIEKLKVTVTSKDQEKTYDGEALVGEYEFSDIVSGHTVNYTPATITEPGLPAPNIPTYIKIYDAYYIDVTDNYDVDTSGCKGKLTVNKIVIMLTSGDVTEKYTGEPIEGNCVATVNPLESKGYIMTLTQKTVTDVGWVENRAIVQVKKDGKDVTNKYYTIINDGCGKITVTQRIIKVKSADLIKEYDGTALTNGTTELSIVVEDGVTDELATGQYIDKSQLIFSGTQTEVGDSPNIVEHIVIKDKNGKDVNSSNYNITIILGKLTVTPPAS